MPAQFTTPTNAQNTAATITSTRTASDVMMYNSRNFDVTAYDDVTNTAPGFHWKDNSTGNTGNKVFTNLDAQNPDITLLRNEIIQGRIHIVVVYYSATGGLGSTPSYIMEAYEYNGTNVILSANIWLNTSTPIGNPLPLPVTALNSSGSTISHIDGDGWGHFGLACDGNDGSANRVYTNMGEVEYTFDRVTFYNTSSPVFSMIAINLPSLGTSTSQYQCDVAINSVAPDFPACELYFVYTNDANTELVYQVHSANTIITDISTSGVTVTNDHFSDPKLTTDFFYHPAIGCSDVYSVYGTTTPPTGLDNHTAIIYEYSRASSYYEIDATVYASNGTAFYVSNNLTNLTGWGCPNSIDNTGPINTYPAIAFINNGLDIVTGWIYDANGNSIGNLPTGVYPVIVYTDPKLNPAYYPAAYVRFYLGLSLSGAGSALSLNSKEERDVHYSYYDAGRVYYKTLGFGTVPLRLSNITTAAPVIYPNPFANAITLTVNEDIHSISLTDITGKLIFATEEKNNEELQNKLQQSVSTLSKGVYILQTRNESNVSQSLKIIKQ